MESSRATEHIGNDERKSGGIRGSCRLLIWVCWRTSHSCYELSLDTEAVLTERNSWRIAIIYVPHVLWIPTSALIVLLSLIRYTLDYGGYQSILFDRYAHVQYQYRDELDCSDGVEYLDQLGGKGSGHGKQ